MYKYRSKDPGNCRVYYRKDDRLYCIQNDGVGGQARHVFYTCSLDGEPDTPIKMPLANQFDRVVLP